MCWTLAGIFRKKGFEVAYLPVGNDGIVDLVKLKGGGGR